MPSYPTNLRVLKRSRRRPTPGDVFAMLPPDGRFLFGRVIRTNVLGPMAATLIYLYSYRADVKQAPRVLSPDALLIPPTLTNALGWYHGVFETIDERPLTEDDVLRQHCFYA